MRRYELLRSLGWLKGGLIVVHRRRRSRGAREASPRERVARYDESRLRARIRVYFHGDRASSNSASSNSASS